MSEQETVMKKKKKQEEKKKITIEEAVAIIKPKYQKYHQYDQSFWDEVYDVYKQVIHGEWLKVLKQAGIPDRTWYHKVEEFCYDLNYPEKGHDNYVDANWHQETEDETSEQQEVIDPEVELDVEQQSNTDLYHQVSSTLSGYKKLSVKMFDLPEKDKLIEMLQDAIKKLNGLLLKLESNIDDD